MNENGNRSVCLHANTCAPNELSGTTELKFLFSMDELGHKHIRPHAIEKSIFTVHDSQNEDKDTFIILVDRRHQG